MTNTKKRKKNMKRKKGRVSRMLAYKRKWAEDNKEKLAECKRLWRKNNPEKIAEYKRTEKQKKEALRAANPRVFKTSLHQRMLGRKSYHKCKLLYFQSLMEKK